MFTSFGAGLEAWKISKFSIGFPYTYVVRVYGVNGLFKINKIQKQ